MYYSFDLKITIVNLIDDLRSNRRKYKLDEEMLAEFQNELEACGDDVDLLSNLLTKLEDITKSLKATVVSTKSKSR